MTTIPFKKIHSYRDYQNIVDRIASQTISNRTTKFTIDDVQNTLRNVFKNLNPTRRINPEDIEDSDPYGYNFFDMPEGTPIFDLNNPDILREIQNLNVAEVKKTPEGSEYINEVTLTEKPIKQVIRKAIKRLNDLTEKAGLGRFDRAQGTKGGIDFNAANMNLLIKRDGRGVPLPLSQQDMAQLMKVQGFVPEIIEIRPAVNVPIISELQQKLQTT